MSVEIARYPRLFRVFPSFKERGQRGQGWTCDDRYRERGARLESIEGKDGDGDDGGILERMGFDPCLEALDWVREIHSSVQDRAEGRKQERGDRRVGEGGGEVLSRRGDGGGVELAAETLLAEIGFVLRRSAHPSVVFPW